MTAFSKGAPMGQIQAGGWEAGPAMLPFAEAVQLGQQISSIDWKLRGTLRVCVVVLMVHGGAGSLMGLEGSPPLCHTASKAQ